MQSELWTAVEQGNRVKIQEILFNTNSASTHYNINVPDSQHKRTPFYMACKRGDPEVVTWFLNHPKTDLYARYDNSSYTPLDSAVCNNNAHITRLLISHPRVDIQLMGWQPIHVAFASDAREECVKYLKEATSGDLVNVRTKGGCTPFFLACALGHVDLVRMAMQNPHVNINLPDNDLETPFFISCCNGYTEVAQLLLRDPSVNRNFADTFDRTPFFISSFYGHEGTIKLLLNTPGIDFDKPNKNGATAFYAVCQEGHDRLAKVMIRSHLVDIHQPTTDEVTPFFIACQRGHDQVVRFLLDITNLDVNRPWKNGITPFWSAAYNNNMKVVKWLLARGVAFNQLNINARSEVGPHPWHRKTAAQIAAESGYHEVARLIEDFERNRAKKIKELRKELGIDGYEAGVLLALIILLNEGYLRIKPSFFSSQSLPLTPLTTNFVKFLQVFNQLPFELQSKLCHMVYDIDAIYIPSKTFADALQDILYFYQVQ